MAWIESHQSVWEHAKTRKAARRLGIPTVQVVGHLQSLWHWAIDHAEDGNLSKYDADDLAIAARWDGDPDELVDALTGCGPGGTAGFLERGGSYGPPEDEVVGDLVVHDWWEYAGKLIARRRRDRLRKAAARSDSPPKDVHGTSDGQQQEAPQDTASRETVNQPTNPTPPNTTSPVGDPDVSPEARLLTREFAHTVKANGHSIPGKGSKARDDWLIAMDRLLRLGPPGEGGHVPDLAEVRKVIGFIATDDFEAPNVQSVPKLRKRYSQLRLKALNGNARASPPGKPSEFTESRRLQ